MSVIKLLFIILVSFNSYSACYKKIIENINTGKVNEAKYDSRNCLRKAKIRIKDEFDEYEDKTLRFKRELKSVIEDIDFCQRTQSINKKQKCLKNNDYSTLKSLGLNLGFYKNKWSEDLSKLKIKKSKNDKALKKQAEMKKIADKEREKVEKAKNDEFRKKDFKFQICRLSKMIKLTEGWIEEEKKIGKISGYVDSSKLYKWGANIVDYDKAIKTYQDYLMNDYKINYSPKDCNKG